MASTVFQIEQGVFRLALVDKSAAGYSDAWQAPGGETVDTATASDYESESAAWGCQATSGALTATPNVENVEVPATFCSPAQTTPSPGVTSYSLDMTFLQDPNIVNGINRFLFEHDTEEAYVFYGLNGEEPPRMIGRVRLIAGTIGGAARTTLTFDASFPMVRKPDIEFGDAAASEVVVGSTVTLSPGTVAPADARVTASDATNAGNLDEYGYVASPTTAWTSGQSASIGTYAFNWTGTAWAPGAHALATKKSAAASE